MQAGAPRRINSSKSYNPINILLLLVLLACTPISEASEMMMRHSFRSSSVSSRYHASNWRRGAAAFIQIQHHGRISQHHPHQLSRPFSLASARGKAPRPIWQLPPRQAATISPPPRYVYKKYILFTFFSTSF